MRRLLFCMVILMMAVGCSTVRPAVNSAIDSLRDVSTIGGEVELGPVSIGGGYDGNGGVNFSFGFDLLGLLCDCWEIGCVEAPSAGSS